MDCVSAQRAIFDDLNIEDICDAHCPLECDSTVYSTSVSSAQYPTNYYWDIIKYQSNILSMATTRNTFKPGSLSPSVSGQNNPTNIVNAVMSNNATTATLNNSPTTTVQGIITTTTTTSAIVSQNDQNAGDPPSVASDSMKSSILAVSVYYDDLKYSLIEEVPAIDFVTLIGVIGIEIVFNSCLLYILRKYLK